MAVLGDMLHRQSHQISTSAPNKVIDYNLSEGMILELLTWTFLNAEWLSDSNIHENKLQFNGRFIYQGSY